MSEHERWVDAAGAYVLERSVIEPLSSQATTLFLLSVSSVGNRPGPRTMGAADRR